MERMFRVLGFWTGIFSVMFYLGDMYGASLLFLGQTGFFVLLCIWRIFNSLLHWIYILYDIPSYTRSWTLRWHTRHLFLYQPNSIVDL